MLQRGIRPARLHLDVREWIKRRGVLVISGQYPLESFPRRVQPSFRGVDLDQHHVRRAEARVQSLGLRKFLSRVSGPAVQDKPLTQRLVCPWRLGVLREVFREFFDPARILFWTM